MKTCTRCGARKRASAFPNRRLRCQDCLRAQDRARIEASRRWIDDFARRWRRSAGKTIDTAVSFIEGRRNGRPREHDGPPHFYYRIRHNAIMAYGGYRCACCGEGEPLFLTIDHVKNGGNRHRRQIGTNHIFAWLRNRGYPPGFQVLCSNCNLGRSRNRGGECPHQAKRRRKRRRAP